MSKINTIDIVNVILKGGHISRFTPDCSNPKEVYYKVFSPIPDPPNKKTLVGNITKKQFNELCEKGIITERKHLQNTDNIGRNYRFYYLSEDIINGIKQEYNEKCPQ